MVLSVIVIYISQANTRHYPVTYLIEMSLTESENIFLPNSCKFAEKDFQFISANIKYAVSKKLSSWRVGRKSNKNI